MHFDVITFRKKYYKGGIELKRPRAEVIGHVILSRPEKRDKDMMHVADKKIISFLRRKASFRKYFFGNLNRNLILNLK